MPDTRRSSENIVVERQASVARLTINRPPLNILDLATLREMRSKLDEAMGEAGLRLIEMRGSGRKAFCTGTDIRDHFPERAPEMLREFHAVVRAVLYAQCPTLAVVRGYCFGGGMELALACDFILGSKDARFGQPEIKLGSFPPVATALLPRLVPEKKALEIILTGETFDAAEAYRLGLVNRAVAANQLEKEVKNFTGSLLAKSPQVVALARKATRLGSREGFESALRESERIYLEELLATEDAVEGLRAFLGKRPPKWRG